MNKKNYDTNLGIMEAIETLSSIVDIAEDKREEVDNQIQQIAKRIEWLESGDADEAKDKIKGIFHTILNYLRAFYRRKFIHASDQKTVDGIKAIMLLVGEAAKKLDHMKSKLHVHWDESITQWREYRLLQEFYQSRIDKRIDERLLSKWLLGLAGTVPAKETFENILEKRALSTKYLFVDLDTVRKDTEYELMLMTKEDGTRFFNPKLLRNIKLVCDFGGTIQEQQKTDPLEELVLWEDRVCFTSAKILVDSQGGNLQNFFKVVARNKELDLVCDITKALMALMCAANENNLLSKQPAKSCREYFMDFQVYLRYALSTREYQKLLVFPPAQGTASHTLLDIIHGLCYALYANLRGINELRFVIDQLVERAHVQAPLHDEDRGHVWTHLSADYAALVQLLKSHPHGPLFKIIEHLEVEHHRGFDSLVQGNIPHIWAEINIGDKPIKLLRLPSPTHQLGIQKANVTDEFKGFVYGSLRETTFARHLLINLQDKTSWRESARCQALEQLQNSEIFSKNLFVITLAVDTEMYHQLPPYDIVDDSESFLNSLLEQVGDETSGFYISEEVQQLVGIGFVERCLMAIHQFFYSSAPQLNRQQRLDFIYLFYLFLEVKLIEAIQPDSFSLTCKDCIDVGSANVGLMMALFMLVNKDQLTERDIESLNIYLHAPAITIRERVMLPDAFNRCISCIKMIEEVKEKMGPVSFRTGFCEAFQPLYDTALRDIQIP